MRVSDSFKQSMSFRMGGVERLPAIEWAPWWDKTLERWQAEGLAPYTDGDELKVALGLDRTRRLRFRCLGSSIAEPQFGQGLIEDLSGYQSLRPRLYEPDQVERNRTNLAGMKRYQDDGSILCWFGMDGFFWLPRVLFGIQNHFYAFYDHPEVIHQINHDLLEYNKYLMEQAVAVLTPDFFVITEDMSYKQGPMLSKAAFDKFIKPYYCSLVPFLKGLGPLVFVDTDGNVDELAGWLLDCGIDGILPIERQSGSSPAALRKAYPQLLMIGGFNKNVMKYGEQAMIQEFESLAPVIRKGGFLPSCDHKTPPDVSLDHYKTYIRLLTQYCTVR